MASHVHSTASNRYPIPLVGFPPAVLSALLATVPGRQRSVIYERIELLAAEGYRLVWIDVLESSVDLELVPAGSEYDAATALLFTIAWPLLEDVAGTA